jgi:hypothetical protein
MRAEGAEFGIDLVFLSGTLRAFLRELCDKKSSYTQSKPALYLITYESGFKSFLISH